MVNYICSSGGSNSCLIQPGYNSQCTQLNEAHATYRIHNSSRDTANTQPVAAWVCPNLALPVSFRKKSLYY